MSGTSLLLMLTDFADECDREYDDAGPDIRDNSESLAIILVAIRDCKADLTILQKKVEQELVQTAGKKRFVVEGLGEVEVRKSTKRNEWDHEGLTRVLVAMAADERIVDEQTGEYEREADAVARVISECAGISYWRVTPLRARHIQVDEFCHEEPADWQVQLPKRKSM